MGRAPRSREYWRAAGAKSRARAIERDGIEAVRAKYRADAAKRVWTAEERRAYQEMLRRRHGVRTKAEYLHAVRLPDRQCVTCLRMFHPRNVTVTHCSKSCGLRKTWPSCAVNYADCKQCRSVFVKRRSVGFCSEDCRRIRHNLDQLERAREYERRTHASARRYWRVANTPEAKSLADTYYELRQELRNGKASAR